MTWQPQVDLRKNSTLVLAKKWGCKILRGMPAWQGGGQRVKIDLAFINGRGDVGCWEFDKRETLGGAF